MPLNTGCSLSAFRANVSELVSTGYPNKQAVAIALAKLRGDCDKKRQPMPEIGEIVPPEGEIEVTLEDTPCQGAELDPDLDGKKADFPYRPTGIWGVFDYKK